MKEILFGMLALFATPVEASWQYAEWGMTPEQVIAASHGTVAWRTVQNYNGAGTRQELGGIASAAGRDFDVSFAFSRLHGLSAIYMDSTQCAGLGNDLRAKYGEPLGPFRPGSAITYWSDNKTNNKIEFDDFGEKCSLKYEPLKAAVDGL